MTQPKVVLDTNVYIRALLNAKSRANRFIWLAKTKRLELVTSKGQLAELVEVVDKYFGDPQGKQYVPRIDLDELLVVLAKVATMVPTTRVNKVSPDPDDDWIIGIAIKAKAGYLVTENPKHIHQRLMPDRPPIEVLSIKEALKRFSLKR